MNVKIAVAFFARLRGLLFRPQKWLEPGAVLLLAPCKSVHTCFMTAPIDVAFIDDNGVVVGSEENVPPWRFLGEQKACATLERFSLTGTFDPRPSCSVECQRWPKVGERLELTAAGARCGVSS